jgi:hypothetical protein
MSRLPDAADAESALKPAELQVLRAQYEKEGEYVSLQTKFNYAWVRQSTGVLSIIQLILIQHIRA